MKRSAKTILTIVNSVVILLLMIATIILIFVANSKEKIIFGQQVKLIVGVTSNESIGENCLVLIKPKEIKKLKAGDYFVHTAEGISRISKAVTVDKNTVTYKNQSGEQESIDASTEEYAGKITSKSNFLGGIFATISTKKNISLTFIFIFGIFVLSMLSLLIAYIIHTKSKGDALEGEETEEVERENATEKITVVAEDDAVLAELASLSEQLQAENEKKLAHSPVKMQANTHLQNDKINKAAEVIDEAAKLRQLESYHKIFDDIVKKPPADALPYRLSDEELPSVSSIIASIDEQFDEIEQDDDSDMKIFTPKS